MSVLNTDLKRICQVKIDLYIYCNNDRRGFAIKKDTSDDAPFCAFWHSPHRTGRNVVESYDFNAYQSTVKL